MNLIHQFIESKGLTEEFKQFYKQALKDRDRVRHKEWLDKKNPNRNKRDKPNESYKGLSAEETLRRMRQKQKEYRERKKNNNH